jgi:hypothetical protein
LYVSRSIRGEFNKNSGGKRICYAGTDIYFAIIIKLLLLQSLKIENLAARSSNGRTTDFGSVCGGSNPSRATLNLINPGFAWVFSFSGGPNLLERALKKKKTFSRSEKS